jgi:hypothetical protein
VQKSIAALVEQAAERLLVPSLAALYLSHGSHVDTAIDWSIQAKIRAAPVHSMAEGCVVEQLLGTEDADEMGWCCTDQQHYAY